MKNMEQKERIVLLRHNGWDYAVATTYTNEKIQREIEYYTDSKSFIMMNIVNEIGEEMSIPEDEEVDEIFDFSDKEYIESQKSNMRLLIKDEEIEIDVNSAEGVVETIIKEYHKNDVCMHDLLAVLELKGFSIEQVFEIYAECMRESDGDITVRLPAESIECSQELAEISRTASVVKL